MASERATRRDSTATTAAPTAPADPPAPASPETDDRAAVTAVSGTVTIDEDRVSEDNYVDTLRATLPAEVRAELDRQSETAALLFAEACYVYGVNPQIEAREILRNDQGVSVRIYPENTFKTPPIPERVKFVTAGGVKIVHPMDADFEEVLRKWLRAYHLDRQTNMVILDPLPADLTLPREAITGIPQKQEHVYKGGYLRSRAAAAAKSAR